MAARARAPSRPAKPQKHPDCPRETRTKADLVGELELFRAKADRLEDQAMAARHLLAWHAGLGHRLRTIAQALAILEGEEPMRCACAGGKA